MTAVRLPDLRSIDDVARAVGVPTAKLRSYAEATAQTAFYRVMHIAKKGRRRSGEFRVVHKASDEWLSNVHRSLAMIITSSVEFPPHVQGFVHARSIRTNAEPHLGARYLLHADIETFFDAITLDQVKRAFVNLGAPADCANLLARLCTIDGALRQGTRCSPVIANLVCMELDVALLALAGSTRSTYTRYADDLTFSGERLPESEGVKAILAHHGFSLRDGRCYVEGRGHSQFVTGLHVGNPERPRLPRRLKRRLRLTLYYVEKFGTDAHFARRVRRPAVENHDGLAGMVRYVQSIEPELGKKLRAQFRIGSKKSHDLRADFRP